MGRYLGPRDIQASTNTMCMGVGLAFFVSLAVYFYNFRGRRIVKRYKEKKRQKSQAKPEA